MGTIKNRRSTRRNSKGQFTQHAIRKIIGLMQEQAAEHLGMFAASLQRYVTGEMRLYDDMEALRG